MSDAPALLPNRLVTGYETFLGGRFEDERQRFRTLAEEGQTPKIMIVGCCDSRVSPEVIFDARPGEIFVVRNVANLVPPYAPDGDLHGTSAALEFAVMGLRVEHIVVMGHALCGGVAALLDGVPPQASDFVAPWIGIASRARDRVAAIEDPAARQQAAERESVRLSIANLRGFPWIAEREAAGALLLTGAHFDIRSGILCLLEDDGEFAPVATD